MTNALLAGGYKAGHSNFPSALISTDHSTIGKFSAQTGLIFKQVIIMFTRNPAFLFIFSIYLLSTIATYAGPQVTSVNNGNNVVYTTPLVREATIEWPDPDPSENFYRENNPEEYQDEDSLKIVLDTETHGNHHFIDVSLIGPSDIRIETQLILDTGASSVVLPLSMMEELDISEEDTIPRRIQTANGIIESFVTELPLLEIGNEQIHDVEVAFVQDNSLGGAKLLGMSALKDYRMTIDNQNETLTLIRIE